MERTELEKDLERLKEKKIETEKQYRRVCKLYPPHGYGHGDKIRERLESIDEAIRIKEGQLFNFKMDFSDLKTFSVNNFKDPIFENKLRLRLKDLHDLDDSFMSQPPLKILSTRDKYLKFYKQAAECFYDLYERTNSDLSLMAFLEVLELKRARDVGAYNLRSIGVDRLSRSNYGGGLKKIETLHDEKEYHRIREVRPSKHQVGDDEKKFTADDDWIEVRNFSSINHNQKIIDFTNCVLIHYGFIKDDLVYTIDGGLREFIYNESLKTGNISHNDFSDFGYFSENCTAEQLICRPKKLPNVKKSCIESLVRFYKDPNKDRSSRESREFWPSLDNCLDYQNMYDTIIYWANDNSIKNDDVCIIIIPDDMLFSLPLSFLGFSYDKPLITEFGGVTICFNLVSLKYAISTYHWTVYENMSETIRCSAFLSNTYKDFKDAEENKNNKLLNLNNEAEILSDVFTPNNLKIFCDSVNKKIFHQHFNSAEICWFAGHGYFDDQNQGPFPDCGIQFYDNALTTEDLLSTRSWSFFPIWLTVLNCCIVGQSITVATNPLGFISALYSSGAISVLSALQAIRNDIATNFAKNFAKEIVQADLKHPFPRACSFSNAIKRCFLNSVNKDEKEEYTSYTLWGLP